MIILGQTLLSDELYEEQFVCDLYRCKGGCCVEGDAGAPLSEEEAGILDSIVSTVSRFMLPAGLEAVNQQGCWVKDPEGELTTPLVEGKQCAYVFWDKKGIACCAIERCWEQGLIAFQKPLSCHLYPVRISNYTHYEALNYHHWHLCDCARTKGRKLKVRVYRFVKDALVRKYGKEWYEDLEAYIGYTYQDG